MLSALEVNAVLAAKDLARARGFYQDKLGLEPVDEDDGGLYYRMQGGGAFMIYETTEAGTARNTVLCWVTTDLEGEMAELRGRGVVFEEYDLPGLKTENGIGTTRDERGAWFTDSEGNILCLAERT